MRSLGVVAIIGLLAGCTLLELEPAPRAPVTAERLLAEVLDVARGGPAEQKAGLARAQAQFQEEPSPANRVRLAALLATLPPPLRDDSRALELLEPLATSEAPGPARLGALLAPQVAERQRLAREVERLSKERAAMAAAERERIAADKERDKREEALRQQLEALRAIERGILEREERARQRPGAKP